MTETSEEQIEDVEDTEDTTADGESVADEEN
jgi:hypothetical protein